MSHSPAQPAAFLSYHHADDLHEGLQITRLRESLAAEVQMQTGRTFEIFQDRNGIGWGDNWHQRIVVSLETVSLLIPILTPGYLSSKFCRAEVEIFVTREHQTGCTNLILPILYLDCPDLVDTDRLRHDRILSVLAARQHVDWRELRFLDPSSKAFRKAVASLAKQICRMLSTSGAANPRPVLPPAPAGTLPELDTEEPTTDHGGPLPPPRAARRDRGIDIYTHFCTAQEAASEERFIGRTRELRRGIGALRASGAAIIIYGFAGVGKTSLAMQLASIAQGHNLSLVEREGFERYLPPGGFDFPVAYYACDRGTDVDLPNTLLSILLNASGNLPLSRLTEQLAGQDDLGEDSASALRNLDQLRALGRCPEALKLAPHVFRNVCAAISRSCAGTPVLMVIDEFNVIKDKNGFAAMLKNEKQDVKLMLVGTAPDVRLLIKEHDSVSRQIAEGQIRVHPMTEPEVNELLSVEERRAQHAFRFSAGARNAIYAASRGYPFFVHFLGRYALDEAIQRDGPDSTDTRLRIDRTDVVAAMHERLADLADLHTLYLQVIDGRWEREIVIKLLACREEEEVPVSNIDVHARTMGVRNVATQLKTLCSKQILLHTVRSHYKFVDERLRIFSRLVPASCEDTRKRMEHFVQVRERNEAPARGWIFPSSSRS